MAAAASEDGAGSERGPRERKVVRRRKRDGRRRGAPQAGPPRAPVGEARSANSGDVGAAGGAGDVASEASGAGRDAPRRRRRVEPGPPRGEMVDQGFWGLEDPLQMRIAIAMTVVASLAFLGFGMFFGGPRPPLGMAIILIATLVINTFAMLLALLLLSGLIDFEFISLDGGILKMAAVVSMQLAIMLIPPEWLGAILAAITGLYLLYYFFDLTYINLFFAGAAFNMIHYAGRWFLPILD